MDISNEQYQRLTRFLDADMSFAEMKAFESELDANPELRVQMELEQQVRSAFEQAPPKAAETQIEKNSPPNFKRWWAAAAAVLIVAPGLIWLSAHRHNG